MGTALALSMKREFVIFVGIRMLERRFDGFFSLFPKEGLNLAFFLYVILYVASIGVIRSGTLTIETMMITLNYKLSD